MSLDIVKGEAIKTMPNFQTDSYSQTKFVVLTNVIADMETVKENE
jgi:hypothetical protein